MENPVNAAKSALNVSFLVKLLVGTVLLLSAIGYARAMFAPAEAFFRRIHFPSE